MRFITTVGGKAGLSESVSVLLLEMNLTQLAEANSTSVLSLQNFLEASQNFLILLIPLL